MIRKCQLSYKENQYHKRESQKILPNYKKATQTKNKDHKKELNQIRQQWRQCPCPDESHPKHLAACPVERNVPK
jgi:hypothetical protein